MGNTNETTSNLNELNEKSNYNTYSGPNKIQKDKGFFDSFICCTTENNMNDRSSGKTDFFKQEYYWFYNFYSQYPKNQQRNLTWIPYSIDINGQIEDAFMNKMQKVKFYLPDNKYVEYEIDFTTMTQTELKKFNFVNDASNYKINENTMKEITIVKRIHRDEEKLIIRRSQLEDMNFLNKLNFIRDYNNTHNLQNVIKINSLFRFLAFPVKCLDIFNKEISVLPEIISTLKKHFYNYRINSFPHLKQLLTEEIIKEAEMLNNIVSKKNQIMIQSQSNSTKLSNYLAQAQIYNDIIELNLNQDNLEAIIIYIFTLEGFLYQRINECLKTNLIESTNLKLIFIIIQASLTSQPQNETYKFLKTNNLFTEDAMNKKHLRLYRGCNLDDEMIQNYLNMLKPANCGQLIDNQSQINKNIFEAEIIEESVQSETLFRRADTNTNISFNSDSKNTTKIRNSLEFILNDFKKKVKQSEEKEQHFCLFNEMLSLTLDRNNALQESLQNNAICIFKFDSSIFSNMNNLQIIYFVENLTLFNSERQAILSPFSIFKLDKIETKVLNDFDKKEIYELHFSFITNGMKKYDYFHFVNHMKIELPFKNLNLEDIKSLSNAIIVNSNVMALNLHGNKLIAESCKNLAEGIKKTESLKLLSLSNCSIDSVGIEFLSQALKINNSIKIVWLNNNNFGSKGLLHLMEMLKTNEKIESIWLDNNSLGYEAGIYISEMLVQNKFLKYLYLRNNELGSQGAKLISEAIKINKTLEGIHLSNNSFGPMGAQYIADALKINLFIKEISINGNKIEKKGADCIAELLEVNKKIFVGKVDY